MTSSLPSAASPYALYDSKRDFSLKSFRSACYAPFITLDFFTTGQVQVCCENDAFPVGNIATDSLLEIWQGPAIRRLREALQRYDFSLGCQGCAWAIQRGGRPFAMNYDMHVVDDEAAAWPRVMQFRLSNLCNYACVMCDGILSSTIRRTRDGLPPLPRAYPDQFFADLEPFLPHLDAAVFAGGEPLLIPENFRVWDRLIQTGNTRTCVSICSNGSVWTPRLDEYLRELNVVHFTVSIDGATRDIFEQVRIGSSFDRVMTNLRQIAAVVQQVRPRGRFGTRAARLTFSYCLMPLNATQMPEVFLLAEDWGADVTVNVVTTPRHCSFLACSADQTRQAHARLQAAYDRIGSRLGQVNQQQYIDTLAVLGQMAGSAAEPAGALPLAAPE